MSSTIRPLPGAHIFSFLQKRYFWKAPTIGSHRSCILGHLVTPTQIWRLKMCSTIRPLPGAHCFTFLQMRHV